ncbi:T9SS type A sorting domain-containing protein [Tenacibaculum sp. Ill]|uniref:T9SS type A sorting domain-containing protein n=1 Tax=Tenacibaculum sp. Ill TaxID=3445935 RepID=UPI003F7A7014
MKTKFNYLLVVLCFACIHVQAQEQKNEDHRKKLKEALKDVGSDGKVKDFAKVLKYYELYKEQRLRKTQETPLPSNSVVFTDSSKEEAINTKPNVTNAIDNSLLNCDHNIQKTLNLLKTNNYKDVIKEATEYIMPCVREGNAEAQLYMGRLYALQETEESYKKAFKLLKKSAEQNNVLAMTDLGVLFKYGRGCKLNYNKARKWFKKAAELGDDKASYSLGYLYLKGYGNIDQDYSKAIKWFKKSNHPMAKYWLGVCYKNGYGIEKNIHKASELLGVEFSDIKATTTSEVTKTNKENHFDEIFNKEQIGSYIQEEKLTESKLIGKWTGQLLQLDWSETDIINKIKFSLEIQKEEDSGNLYSTITIGEKTIKDEIIRLDNTIYFNNTECTLPHITFKEEIPSSLTYQLLSSNLTIKSFDNNFHLIGNVENYINKWKESGTPLRFVLKKEENFENSEEELSEDILKALSEQENNFIQLYPNPVQNDLIIAYELAQPATVKVQINDTYGNLISVIKTSKTQEKGKYRYFFDASNLQIGVYVVSVFVNNERKTRITIKK